MLPLCACIISSSQAKLIPATCNYSRYRYHTYYFFDHNSIIADDMLAVNLKVKIVAGRNRTVILLPIPFSHYTSNNRYKEEQLIAKCNVQRHLFGRKIVSNMLYISITQLLLALPLQLKQQHQLRMFIAVACLWLSRGSQMTNIFTECVHLNKKYSLLIHDNT